DGEVVQTFDADGAEVDGMAFSPDGEYFAHASHRSVTVRRSGDWGQVHRPVHKEGNAINSIDFSKETRYMISAGQYERVILTRIADWKEVRTYVVEPRSSIKSTRFSPDGKLIAAGYGDAKQVVVFRVGDGSVVRQTPMPCYIEAVAWTTDGDYLLAGGRDEGLLHVFSTADWTKVTTVSAQENASVEYIDTLGDLIVTGGEDGHIRLFRISAADRPESLTLSLAEEPHPVNERYWWLDEIRTVSQALGKARSGQYATWPQMTVEAGWGTLPLPQVTTAIETDGKLDEPAWQKATSLPVGPIFADFQQGPFTLQVSACRNDAELYIAIHSPQDLSRLGTAFGSKMLLKIADQPFLITKASGKIQGGIVRKDSTGQIIELALPLPEGPIQLKFYPELVRRRAGTLAGDLRYLGLDKHKRGAWLDPFIVKLIPAPDAIRFKDATSDPNQVQLSYTLRARDRQPKTRTIKLRETGESGVYRYRYTLRIQENSYEIESCLYVEPVAETLDAARQILSRLVDHGLPNADYDAMSQTIDGLDQEFDNVDFSDGKKWRQLYCRARQIQATAHRSMLDAPLLFVKRHPYYAGHIYDDYLTWHPGGGIYLIDNPAAAMADRTTRPVVDPGTVETLGGGIYRDPDLSWDAKRIVFAHKDSKDGDTSLYEIGVDGRSLRRLTDPARQCTSPPPVRALGAGHHDITPAYLPDGRIVFTSTRPAGRVPCFNSEVDMLHVINADGSNIRCLSVNNVNEFDPAPLDDGRILYGRWEYVDKTALYMQSLWTMLPDGTQETALFANNIAKPTALLDARGVPGTSLIAASLTPHNGQAVGAIAIIDPRLGKNELAAVTNFTPEYPVQMDQGLSDGPSDPWPLSQNDIMFANNAIGGRGIIELVDRQGNRELVHAEPDISCYAPMLVKPRKRPMVVSGTTIEDNKGRFMVHDIYRGLTGVRPGQVKWLRIVEETTRISGIPGGGRWWNQAFLVSWQGAYVVKNILGLVPVFEDGSAYFEVPAGRALYFQALDEQGRE
ncbi:MAG: PD40 domain-containing protein, partial [Phycisphaerales bacterium]